jgi:hypothetical protein
VSDEYSKYVVARDVLRAMSHEALDNGDYDDAKLLMQAMSMVVVHELLKRRKDKRVKSDHVSQ